MTTIALAALLAAPASAGGVGLCRQAESRDTQKAWTRVLEQAPDAPCAAVARARLDQLSADLRACSEARRADTLAAWHAYSMAHPTGECGLEAITQVKMREATGESLPEPAPAAGDTDTSAPHVEVEVVATDGAFDTSAVRVLFGPGQATLLGCAPEAPAEVPVSLSVSAGELEEGAEAPSDVPGLGDCVIDRLAELDWPRVGDATAIELVVTFGAPTGSR